MESEEEQCFCNNCKRLVSSSNFAIHSAFCERNIFVCTICEEPVPISERDEHLEDYHAISPCNLCEAPLEKWLLPKHMEICPKRHVQCNYCEASFSLDEHTEHVEFCGSRTEKCLLCQKYIMNKDKSKHDEVHLLEKRYRTKNIEDEIKQNKVNEVISNKSTPEKTPETIHSLPSKISEGKDACVSDKLKSKTSREERDLETPARGRGAASFPRRETLETIHSKGKDACVLDKLKSKTSREEHNLEIPARGAGAASVPGREISKHYTECHICKQTIPWIDFNTHIPACASSAGKCSVCTEYVPNHEIKEHMKSHFQGGMNKSLKVSENYESSNITTYRSIQTNGAESKTHISLMKCPYCSELCSEDQVLEHTRSCPKNMYECPLCSEKISEKDRKRHEDFECRMVQNNIESNTSHFSRLPQNGFECPLCMKLIPEENYDLHVSLQCEQLSRVGGTHELYAAGDDLYECVYCTEKMPQKDKTMHHNFSCKVLIENSGINLSGLDSYADIAKKTDHNSYKNDQSSETCPTCKNTFSKWKIAEHRNKCSRLKEPCTFCNLMIDVSCRDIHLHYCPGIDNRDHKTTVAQDYKYKGAIPKNTSIKDMMKPRSAKCFYCHTSYNVDILPNHEKECIHMPILCDFCDTQILLKDVNAHNCKRKKENVSCSIQTDVPVIDVENPKDEDLSFLDAKDVTLLTEGMKKLLIKGSDHDVKIVVKDKEFRAHRNILCARSPVFAMILSHDTEESNTGTITVSDCDPDSFDELLLYVYTGKMENLTPSKAFHLYYTADKYDFPALKERCVILLKTSLSVESVCDVVFLAAKHGEKELLEAATEFFALNMREILVTVRWQEFLSENPVEGNELYIKSMDILVPRK